MKKRILINAVHDEEKRVAIIEGDTLSDFYVESSGREHLKGNVYKGVVARVEPGLQAACVDFGQKKHGFLQLREIKKEFFKKEKEEGKRPRIQDVIVKGQELIVQVEKDERDTKGASLTTYLSLPGRYIVMMPGEAKVGISRKIEGREDRDRIKEVFNSLKLPKDMGFILRTACSDKTSEELNHDLEYLTKLWNKIKAESKKVKAPALIYKEQDIAVRTVRDYLSADVVEVLIDDATTLKLTKEFLKKTSPWLKINIKQYKDKKPIFSMHNIEEQISRIHDRHVYLPSRGYLVIDKTEALTAIDVNSGRSRKEENIEGTALRTNLEAAEELARQLRIRDIGGLIVIDFIDMESSKNRREVEKVLKEAFVRDKAHTEISGISKFGMVEMTRERMRPAYLEAINKRCDICGGTGVVKSDETVAVTALRSVHARAAKGGVKSMTCRLPVESLNYILANKHEDIWNVEKDYGIRIFMVGDRKLSGQYELDIEKTDEEIKAEEEAKALAAQKNAQEQRHKNKKEHQQGKSRPAPGQRKQELKDAGEGIEPAVQDETVGPAETAEVPEAPAETDASGAPSQAEDAQLQGQKKKRPRNRYRRRGRGKKPNRDEAGAGNIGGNPSSEAQGGNAETAGSSYDDSSEG